MAPFEEIQQLWRNQPQSFAVTVDVRGTVNAFRRFGRRQNIINTLKAGLIVFQTWYCLHKLGISALTVCGQALFVAGIANILLADWRNQMGIARLDFTIPPAGFIEKALARMDHPNAGYRQRLWLTLPLVCTGMNLLGLSRSGSPLPDRLVVHMGMTAALLVTFAAGLKLHAKRCEMEYRPIKERLIAMKMAIEEQHQ